MGDLMVLVREGVDSPTADAHLDSALAGPQSDHERYLRDYVVPTLHGVDLTQPPAPPADLVASTTE
jgi:hypothetical protein